MLLKFSIVLHTDAVLPATAIEFIEQLAQSQYKNISELIICCKSVNKNDALQLATYSGKFYLRTLLMSQDKDISYVLNKAIEHITTEYILFIGANQNISIHTITTALEYLVEKNVDIVSIPLKFGVATMALSDNLTDDYLRFSIVSQPKSSVAKVKIFHNSKRKKESEGESSYPLGQLDFLAIRTEIVKYFSFISNKYQNNFDRYEIFFLAQYILDKEIVLIDAGYANTQAGMIGLANEVCINEHNLRILRERIESFVHSTHKHASTRGKKINKKDYWDTRECCGVTYPGKDIPLPSAVYLFPAIMTNRNTKRYRVNHFMELSGMFCELVELDYKTISQNFFDQLREMRSIVIVQRLAIHDSISERFMQKLKEAGAFIVYDIDDQIFDEGELEEWRIQQLPHHPRQYMHCMQYADHFFVSTKELRRKIEQFFSRPTHIVRNVLSKELFNISSTCIKDKDNKFIIGCTSGSRTHDHDVLIIISALHVILSTYKDIEIYFAGEMEIPQNLIKEYPDRITVLPSTNWFDFPRVLNLFSVLLIPLEDVHFNRYKSQIKFLEASAVKVPVISSNISELAEGIINGVTGFLVDNRTDRWVEAIDFVYNNYEQAIGVAHNAYEVIKKYWTTESRFQLSKIRNVLQDLVIGLLRDKISIVIVVYNQVDDVKSLIESVLINTEMPYELLVWINSQDEETRSYINSLNIDNLYCLDFNHNFGKAFAANSLFRLASERFIAGLDDDYILPKYWDIKMINSAKGTPNLGWLSTNLSKNSSGLRDKGKCAFFKGGTSLYLPSGVGGWVVFGTASSFKSIGFYREHGLYGGIDGDFNRRARALGYTTGYVPDVVGHHKITRTRNLPWELFKQRIQDEMRIHGKHSNQIKDKFIDYRSLNKTKLQCSIKICTSIHHDENVWGDTHFANSLKSYLINYNLEIRIDKHEHWYDDVCDSDDVTLHLFGLHKYVPNPRHLNLLWIISHTDLLDIKFLSNFDYIFCSSSKVTQMVANMVPKIRVETLLQCTDTNIFYPSNLSRIMDFSFVGNSRRIFRNSIRFAIESGFDVCIWGTKWEQFIDKSFIRGQSLTNSQTSDVYRQTKIVLNDHWKDQLSDNLINNRVFDALACDTIIFSDRNDGFDEIFGSEKIPTFTDLPSFQEVAKMLLNNYNTTNELAREMGSFVRESHTFSNRAFQINNAILFLIENYVTYKSEELYNYRKLLALNAPFV